MIPLGRMRHRLALEAPERTDDGAGGGDIAWQTLASVWAEIRTLSGRESVRTETTVAEATHRITIRHRTDIDPAMRFSGAGRVYAIVAILPDHAHRRRTVCLCRERPVA